MTSKRENILATIRTKLVDTAGVGTRIFRTRVDPIARAESPAIIIQPIRDVCVQTTSLPKLDWTMTVRITVIERADIPDQAADDTVESLHSKIMADLTLGGYAHDATFEAMFNAHDPDAAMNRFVASAVSIMNNYKIEVFN